MRSGHNANHGGAFLAAQRTDALVAEARASVARLLGGTPQGVVFGPSMTALTMRFSAAIGRTLRPGDEIVCTRLDHDANVAPWLIAAERAGAQVRFAEPDRETLELPAAAVEAVLSERTRWVAVTAASNAVGTIPDLPGIVAAAHSAGARIFVDAVHATPHRALDVAALGCDALACSAYKWFGPHIGILWARPDAAGRPGARQAAPLARHRARPLGARHAALRVAGRRPRRRRLPARARPRGPPRPRGSAAGADGRGPGVDRRRRRARRGARPHRDGDVHGRRPAPARRRRGAGARRGRRVARQLLRAASSRAGWASSPTARCAPASCLQRPRRRRPPAVAVAELTGEPDQLGDRRGRLGRRSRDRHCARGPSPARSGLASGASGTATAISPPRTNGDQLEAVAAPEAPGVVPAGRSLAREQAHVLVGGGDQLGAVDRLDRLLRAPAHAPGGPLARQPQAGREGVAVVALDDLHQPVLVLALDRSLKRAHPPTLPVALLPRRHGVAELGAVAPRAGARPSTRRAGSGPARRATAAAADRRARRPCQHG